MALDPLATVADLEARGVTVALDEVALVETYLDTASAAVREAAGVPISEATSTVVLEGETDVRLRLPGPPVTSVDAVAVEGDAVEDYRPLADAIWRRRGWRPVPWEPSEVEVTYTHGLPTVPADIVDLVSRMAATALVAWRESLDGGGIAVGRVTQERIGDYSVSYADDGTLSEMELPETTRDRLRARFGGGVAVLRSR